MRQLLILVLVILTSPVAYAQLQPQIEQIVRESNSSVIRNFRGLMAAGAGPATLTAGQPDTMSCAEVGSAPVVLEDPDNCVSYDFRYAASSLFASGRQLEIWLTGTVYQHKTTGKILFIHPERSGVRCVDCAP